MSVIGLVLPVTPVLRDVASNFFVLIILPNSLLAMRVTADASFASSVTKFVPPGARKVANRSKVASGGWNSI
jgi:hypothetical protein